MKKDGRKRSGRKEKERKKGNEKIWQKIFSALELANSNTMKKKRKKTG
jgi:hypothetical protein